MPFAAGAIWLYLMAYNHQCMIRTTLLIIICLFSSLDALCCSCYPKGRITVKDFNAYDLIFIGTLIYETRSDKDDYRFRREGVYKIISAFKGTVPGDTVRVYDSEDNGACGLGRLTVGRDYLIYAYGNEKKQTSDCSRTTRVPIQFWPRDSASINKLKGLSSFGRIYDTTRTNFHADTLFLNKHVLKIKKNSKLRFYDADGHVSAEGRYVNGVPEGFWNYFEAGRVATKGKYINGKKDSLWVEPYNKEMVYVREYKAGTFTYKETLFYDGRIASKTEPLGNGKKWIRYDYHHNGQPRYIEYTNPPKRNQSNQLEDPVSDGPFKMFNRSGVVLQEGNNKDGLSTGRWKYYFEDGKLRMEGDYIKGEKAGLWKIYYHIGNVKAAGAYRNDEKDGVWKYFDERGKEIPPDPKLIEEDEDWFTYSAVKN